MAAPLAKPRPLIQNRSLVAPYVVFYYKTD
jgi:hypothetical protein